jgi:hypothetical protein
MCLHCLEAEGILVSDFLRSGATLDVGRQLRIKRGPKAHLVLRDRERDHESDRRVKIFLTTFRSLGSNARRKRYEERGQ